MSDLKKITWIIKDFTEKQNQDHISAFAASAAFFLMISAVPILMLLCALIPYTPLTEGVLMEAATNLAPDQFDPLLITVIHDVYANSGGLLSLALLTTLWSAGKGMQELVRGLNVVNGVVERRNFFWVRLEAIVYMVVILVVTVITLVFIVFQNGIFGTLVKLLPMIKVIIETFLFFRYFWVFFILTITFGIFYTLIPNKKLYFKLQLPGAMFSALGWMIFSWGFSLYVTFFHSFSAYGTMGTILILMIWLYACMYIFLIGANLNRYFYKSFLYLLGRKEQQDN